MTDIIPPEQWDEGKLRAAIAVANIPTLLMLLVQMTGDLRWLEDPYRPSRTKGLGDNDTGDLDAHVQLEIRTAALDAILAWGNGQTLAIPVPSPDLLVDMLSVSMGEAVPHEYADMMSHELGLDSDVDRRRTLPGARVNPPQGFDAIIVGAGASGICASIKLKDAGIPFVVLERNDDVGGTWLENRYPGCAVDTPSHLYSFSFAKNDWSQYFAARDEIFGYFKGVAAEFGVLPHVRFRTEVVSAGWDEDQQRWHVEVVDRDGRSETLSASLLITAVGAFNKPKMPSIAGLASFAGPTPHTARWPDDLDLTGQRVGVIGNGASAMQLVPAIADIAGEVTVFQRSPQWAAPFEWFKTPVPEGIRYLFQAVPLYRAWYRVRLAWTFNDKVHSSLQKDPSWPHPDRSINEVNDGHRRYFTRHIVRELGDRQDLLDEVLPDYPPFGKRMLLDNGWFRTLTRGDVHLVTKRVNEVRANSVVTADGIEHELDVLVLATGFDVVRFLAPMQITGRSGRTLESAWDGDDARAYLGLAVPDFPNLFCLYGPNTQFGHGGSLLFMMELQMHYLMDLLQQMFEQGIGSVECRQDVYDEYNKRVDEAHGKMVWTHPGMDVYYRNSKGRVVVNNPFKVVDFWRMLRHANLSEFRTVPARERAQAK
jgi:4-hydroxyacetophenone monooxygenase